MAGTAHFTTGAEVSCSDGACGQVRRVAVDPVARAVTHLVAGPERPRRLRRLVPADLAGAIAGEIRLRCTLAGFARLGRANKTHFLKKNGLYPGDAPGQVFSWPCYGVMPFMGTGMGNLQQTVTCHSVLWERRRSAAANLSMPATATSAGPRASSSAPAITT